MPKRLLDDSLLTSPSIARLSPRAQDAFHRFILLADDFGCFDANPRVLLGRGWPLRDDVSEKDLADWMDEYEAAGMLQRWTDNGRTYAYLTGWHGAHGQKHRAEYDPVSCPKGSKRRTPKPPIEIGNSRAGNPKSDDRDRDFPGSAVPVPVPVAVPEKTTAANDAPHRSPPAPVVPLDASPFVRWLSETYPDIKRPAEFEASCREAYPSVDLLAAARAARAWEVANPAKKKSQHGRFLNNWFSREQDRPRPVNRSTVSYST